MVSTKIYRSLKSTCASIYSDSAISAVGSCETDTGGKALACSFCGVCSFLRVSTLLFQVQSDLDSTIALERVLEQDNLLEPLLRYATRGWFSPQRSDGIVICGRTRSFLETP